MVAGIMPVSRALYRTTPLDFRELKAKLQELMDEGFIRQSVSHWGHANLIIRHKGGNMWLCFDYRMYNEVIVKNRCPLPWIDDLFD